MVYTDTVVFFLWLKQNMTGVSSGNSRSGKKVSVSRIDYDRKRTDRQTDRQTLQDYREFLFKVHKLFKSKIDSEIDCRRDLNQFTLQIAKMSILLP